MNNSYIIYLIISLTTIASPGPGVVMTLTNSLKYGLKESIYGILGITVGMFLISVLVGGGIGIAISSSNILFNILKIFGALYLFYLGIKLIKNRNNNIEIEYTNMNNNKFKSFLHGLGITIINPKPILFFLALFPQFIKTNEPYINQFLFLTITFCILIIIVHFIYAMFASYLKKKTSNKNYYKYINTLGGSAYILFSISLILFAKNK